MIYSSWDIEQNILKLVILGHLLPFYPHKNAKIKILKNVKICWRYHFTCVYQKSQSYDVRFLRYRVRQAEVFVTLGHFLPFQPPDNPENKNFKIEKNTWKYYNFTYLPHKWQSYDVWFLRYGGQHKLFYSGPFFCFTPLWTKKIKILEKWTTHLKISSIYKCVP